MPEVEAFLGVHEWGEKRIYMVVGGGATHVVVGAVEDGLVVGVPSTQSRLL